MKYLIPLLGGTASGAAAGIIFGETPEQAALISLIVAALTAFILIRRVKP